MTTQTALVRPCGPKGQSSEGARGSDFGRRRAGEIGRIPAHSDEAATTGCEEGGREPSLRTGPYSSMLGCGPLLISSILTGRAVSRGDLGYCTEPGAHLEPISRTGPFSPPCHSCGSVNLVAGNLTGGTRCEGAIALSHGAHQTVLAVSDR